MPKSYPDTTNWQFPIGRERILNFNGFQLRVVGRGLRGGVVDVYVYSVNSFILDQNGYTQILLDKYKSYQMDENDVSFWYHDNSLSGMWQYTDSNSEPLYDYVHDIIANYQDFKDETDAKSKDDKSINKRDVKIDNYKGENINVDYLYKSAPSSKKSLLEDYTKPILFGCMLSMTLAFVMKLTTPKIDPDIQRYFELRKREIEMKNTKSKAVAKRNKMIRDKEALESGIGGIEQSINNIDKGGKTLQQRMKRVGTGKETSNDVLNLIKEKKAMIDMNNAMKSGGGSGAMVSFGANIGSGLGNIPNTLIKTGGDIAKSTIGLGGQALKTTGDIMGTTIKSTGDLVGKIGSTGISSGGDVLQQTVKGGSDVIQKGLDTGSNVIDTGMKTVEKLYKDIPETPENVQLKVLDIKEARRMEEKAKMDEKKNDMNDDDDQPPPATNQQATTYSEREKQAIIDKVSNLKDYGDFNLLMNDMSKTGEFISEDDIKNKEEIIPYSIYETLADKYGGKFTEKAKSKRRDIDNNFDTFNDAMQSNNSLENAVSNDTLYTNMRLYMNAMDLDNEDEYKQYYDRINNVYTKTKDKKIKQRVGNILVLLKEKKDIYNRINKNIDKFKNEYKEINTLSPIKARLTLLNKLGIKDIKKEDLISKLKKEEIKQPVLLTEFDAFIDSQDNEDKNNLINPDVSDMQKIKIIKDIYDFNMDNIKKNSNNLLKFVRFQNPEVFKKFISSNEEPLLKFSEIDEPKIRVVSEDEPTISSITPEDIARDLPQIKEKKDIEIKEEIEPKKGMKMTITKPKRKKGTLSFKEEKIKEKPSEKVSLKSYEKDSVKGGIFEGYKPKSMKKILTPEDIYNTKIYGKRRDEKYVDKMSIDELQKVYDIVINKTKDFTNKVNIPSDFDPIINMSSMGNFKLYLSRRIKSDKNASGYDKLLLKKLNNIDNILPESVSSKTMTTQKYNKYKDIFDDLGITKKDVKNMKMNNVRDFAYYKALNVHGTNTSYDDLIDLYNDIGDEMENISYIQKQLTTKRRKKYKPSQTFEDI